MDNLYDAAVIGGGPAGLTAALYLARARYRVVVIEKEHFGGQITITSEVVNYPGVPRTSGSELTKSMQKQAESFGAEFLLAEVTGLDMEDDVKKVHTSRGSISCFGVLLATGAHPRMIGFEGEEAFRGHGVAYCATCDGEFFAGKEVFVAGGGFAAAEESVFLTKYASHVTILIRGNDFSCAKATADEARNHEKITVLTNTEIQSVSGDTVLNEIKYRNNVTGEVTTYYAKEGDTFGVFVFAGYEPATDLVHGIADLDDKGYVITDRNQKTNVDGLYAAGDVCIKSLRQVVTAVGDGALAATELERYAAAMQIKTGRKSEFPDTRAQNPKIFDSKGKKSEHVGDDSAESNSVFSEEIIQQLKAVFDKMERPLVLKLSLDERPVSAKLRSYMETMATLTDKLRVEILSENEDDPAELPCVRIFYPDGTDTGLAFHGVPGGHEFTSFVLCLYNASGPGQKIDERMKKKIDSMKQEIHIQIMVSLSCTMCPELVTAAQRIAAVNPHIRAEVYDLNHFPKMKEKYHVMSVPCFVVNNGEPHFGKKNMEQLLDIIGS